MANFIPQGVATWYGVPMNGTYKVVVGDRGRLVVPVEVRERAGLDEGTVMILVETDDGLVLLSQEQLRARVRADRRGTSLVEELLGERREAAAAEDRAGT